MASPRSMASLSIELSLLNIPVTIGKAVSETHESSLVQVCNHEDGAININRSERCEKCKGAPKNKAHAIRMEDGTYRVVNQNEWNTIEDSTKTESLQILDCQKLTSLPMMYANGTYYVRHNDKAKVAPKAFATLAATLMRDRLGLICKWGNSSRQKLCVIYVESGVMILKQIPFVEDIRPASDKERAHFRAAPAEAEVEKMGELLSAVRNPEGFQYASYHDEGLRLRQEAVQRILDGEPLPEKSATIEEPAPDPFEMIDRAIKEAKVGV